MHYFSSFLARSILVAGLFAPQITLAQSNGDADDLALNVAMSDGCTVLAEPLHFGLLFGTAGTARSTSSIRLACAPDVDFNISIDYGLNANGINRRMQNDLNGDYLRYRIYSDPGYRSAWSTKKKERVGGSSGEAGRVDYVVYGEIMRYDASVRGGTYSDTLTVVIDF